MLVRMTVWSSKKVFLSRKVFLSKKLILQAFGRLAILKVGFSFACRIFVVGMFAGLKMFRGVARDLNPTSEKHFWFVCGCSQPKLLLLFGC